MENKYKAMSVKELFLLNIGDQVRIFWAKDDNLEYTRLNCEVQTVTDIDHSSNDLMVETGEGYQLLRL